VLRPERLCNGIPSTRPSRDDIFGSVQLDYKLVLNLVALVAFVTLFWHTERRGASDPVCGMKVDRSKAVHMTYAGETHYFCSGYCWFCSGYCWHAFEADPERYVGSATVAEEVRIEAG
jgi:uncharacterized protein